MYLIIYFIYNEVLAERISGALKRSLSLRNSNTVNMSICGKLLLLLSRSRIEI